MIVLFYYPFSIFFCKVFLCIDSTLFNNRKMIDVDLFISVSSYVKEVVIKNLLFLFRITQRIIIRIKLSGLSQEIIFTYSFYKLCEEQSYCYIFTDLCIFSLTFSKFNNLSHILNTILLHYETPLLYL